MRPKRFVITLMFGLLVFVTVNIHEYWQTKPQCCDASSQFGVPFPLGRTGGYVGATNIHWGGLLADAFIAGAVSILLAFMIEKVFRHRAPGGPEGNQSIEVKGRF